MTVKILSGIGLSLACQAAFAGAITDIKVTSLSEQQKIIKIKFDKELVEPKGFLNKNDTSLVLDFQGSNTKLPQAYLEYNDSLVKSISAAEDKNRTRLALDLGMPSEFYTEKKQDEIWVYVSGNNKQAATKPVQSPTVLTEPANTNDTKIPAPIVIKETIVKTEAAPAHAVATAPSLPVQMAFNKGKKNSGRVVLTIPANAPKPKITKNAASLTVVYTNVILPAAEQKKLDTSELLTPVQSVTLESLGANTQVIINTKGSWDYKEYAENGKYVFEIIPTTNMADSATSPLTRKKNFKGNKVTLDFQNIEVRTVLQILAKESGMNIVASDSVGGSMTLNLKDVPWDQALDLVMQSQNLDIRKQGNIINIAPRDELFEKDKRTLTYEQELQSLGPLVSQTFQLRYKNVEEFKEILKLGDGTGSGDRNSILSGRGSALIDPSTNTLIITDNPSVIKKFAALIDELDVAAQQVMIEARIVEAQTDFLRSLGTKISHSKTGDGRWTGGSNWTPGDSSGSSSLNIIRSGLSSVVNLEIQAHQAEGNAKIISSPRVLTQDRQEALIEKGTEIPYQEASSSGATSTSFKKAVLGLTVTPQITPDGNIIMDLQINKDSVGGTPGQSEPPINTNQIKTKAMVENGGTLILGGVYEERKTENETKVPVLGDIPLLGNLFKFKSREHNKSELLIFITPRIVPQSNSSLRY